MAAPTRRQSNRKYLGLVGFVIVASFVLLHSLRGFEEHVVTPDMHTMAPPAAQVKLKPQMPVNRGPQLTAKVNEPKAEIADTAVSQRVDDHGEPEPTVAKLDDSFVLPFRYPMHDKLPPKESIAAGIFNQQLSTKRTEQCLKKAAPIFFQPPTTFKSSMDSVTSTKLETEFDFENPSKKTFFTAEKEEELGSEGRPWWVPIAAKNPYKQTHAGAPMDQEEDSNSGEEYSTEGNLDVFDEVGNLPCTEEVQRRLWLHQHPSSCANAKFLVSRLKEGMHGIGSAVTLVAHDFLSAMILGRVLVIDSHTRWYFSAKSCNAERQGWNCLFAAPTQCPTPRDVAVVNHRNQAAKAADHGIRKKNFDISGLGRNDSPSVERFFGEFNVKTKGRCYSKVQQWLKDPANTYIMGTFQKGADPMLFYMMAQVTRYLMRAPQPWFQAMLQSHFKRLHLSDVAGRSDELLVQDKPTAGKSLALSQTAANASTFKLASAMMVYVQERGEIAKFREYYNALGCHTVDNKIFAGFATKMCAATHEAAAKAMNEEKFPVAMQEKCNVELQGNVFNPQCSCVSYISGNTPIKGYKEVRAQMEHKEIAVLSTWKHPAMGGGNEESERWGASAAFASWVDLYAGVASTGWVCTVQSNWCRVINFLRLTAGRAQCPFVDIGALMLSSGKSRRQYCIVKKKWPTKPFSGAKKQ